MKCVRWGDVRWVMWQHYTTRWRRSIHSVHKNWMPVHDISDIQLYNNWQLPYACPLSPLKLCNVRRRNLACRCKPTVCNTWAGSYVDRSHRCEENQHFSEVVECKQTCCKQTISAIFHTLCRVPLCRVEPTVLMYNVSMGTGKIRDGARRWICIQWNGAHSAIGMGHSSRTDRSDISACLSYFNFSMTPPPHYSNSYYMSHSYSI